MLKLKAKYLKYYLGAFNKYLYKNEEYVITILPYKYTYTNCVDIKVSINNMVSVYEYNEFFRDWEL